MPTPDFLCQVIQVCFSNIRKLLNLLHMRVLCHAMLCKMRGHGGRTEALALLMRHHDATSFAVLHPSDEYKTFVADQELNTVHMCCSQTMVSCAHTGSPL